MCVYVCGLSVWQTHAADGTWKHQSKRWPQTDSSGRESSRVNFASRDNYQHDDSNLKDWYEHVRSLMPQCCFRAERLFSLWYILMCLCVYFKVSIFIFYWTSTAWHVCSNRMPLFSLTRIIRGGIHKTICSNMATRDHRKSMTFGNFKGLWATKPLEWQSGQVLRLKKKF